MFIRKYITLIIALNTYGVHQIMLDVSKRERQQEEQDKDS